MKFKSRLSYGDPAQIARKRNIPGPGTHEDKTQLNKYGVYASSEMPNSKSARWAKDGRLKQIKKHTSPGPGQHETYGETAKAFNFASQFHTILTPSFGVGER